MNLMLLNFANFRMFGFIISVGINERINMQVSKVGNDNSKVVLYSGLATVAGGGLGALAGWNTKPFLQDDGPSDTFVRKVVERGGEIVAEDNPMFAQIKDLAEKSNSAKSIEELKTIVLKPMREMYESLGDDIDGMKQALTCSAELTKSMGISTFSSEDIASVKSVDDVVELLGRDFDKLVGGRTLEELRQSSFEESHRIMKESVKTMFTNLWDSKSKSFIKIEKDVDLDASLKSIVENSRNLLEDVAKGMKGKAALIYGISTAAVAGLGTLAGIKLAHKPAKELSEQKNEQKID